MRAGGRPALPVSVADAPRESRPLDRIGGDEEPASSVPLDCQMDRTGGHVPSGHSSGPS